jgi:hypothetical protein
LAGTVPLDRATARGPGGAAVPGPRVHRRGGVRRPGQLRRQQVNRRLVVAAASEVTALIIGLNVYLLATA